MKTHVADIDPELRGITCDANAVPVIRQRIKRKRFADPKQTVVADFYELRKLDGVVGETTIGFVLEILGTGRIRQARKVWASLAPTERTPILYKQMMAIEVDAPVLGIVGDDGAAVDKDAGVGQTRVQALFDEVVARGFRADITMWNALMRAANRSGEHHAVGLHLRAVLKQGMSLNEASFVEVLTAADGVDQVTGLVDHMRTRWLHDLTPKTLAAGIAALRRCVERDPLVVVVTATRLFQEVYPEVDVGSITAVVDAAGSRISEGVRNGHPRFPSRPFVDPDCLAALMKLYTDVVCCDVDTGVCFDDVVAFYRAACTRASAAADATEVLALLASAERACGKLPATAQTKVLDIVSREFHESIARGVKDPRVWFAAFNTFAAAAEPLRVGWLQDLMRWAQVHFGEMGTVKLQDRESAPDPTRLYASRKVPKTLQKLVGKHMDFMKRMNANAAPDPQTGV